MTLSGRKSVTWKKNRVTWREVETQDACKREKQE